MENPLNAGTLGGTLSNATASQSSGSTSPIAGIIGTALNILPFVAPEIGIPARIALGTLASAGANAVEGKPQSLTGDLMSGVSDGVLGGIGKGAGAAKEAEAGAEAAAGDAASAEAKGASESMPDEFGYVAKPNDSSFAPQTQPAVQTQTNPTIVNPVNPTSINPDNNMGHVNFSQDSNGTLSQTPNTFTEPTATESQNLPNSYGTPKANIPDMGQASPDITNRPPTSGAQATSAFIPQDGIAPQMSSAQQSLRNTAVKEMINSMQANGMKLSNSDYNKLANMALNAGKNDFPSFANEANMVTGQNNGLNNAVENALRQASIGDSLGNAAQTDLTDVFSPQARREAINEATMGTTQRGGGGATYNDSQRNLFDKVLQDQNITLAGAGNGGYRTLEDAVNSGDLVLQPTGKNGTQAYELSSQGLKNINHLDALQASRNLMARGFDPRATAGEQDLYQKMGNSIKSKLNDIKLTPEIKQHALSNMQENGFATSNPTMYKALETGLSNGNISTVGDLQKFQSPWVNAVKAYSDATGGASKFDLLTNGKSGLINGLLNSDAATRTKIAAARKASNEIAKDGDIKAFNELEPGDTEVSTGKSGGKGMSPLQKKLLLTGIIGTGVGAAGIGLNTAATANQSQQAQDLLNDPQYQKTQSILANQDALQRYLGEQGEIRSIFAPTFDSNAGSAGQTGAAMLQSANQNQAARTAAANLLAARAGMGQGGVLGDILSFIPGTAENNYKQQANNAIAQLNSQGVAGSAPSVAQSSASIPALAGIANSVGGF